MVTDATKKYRDFIAYGLLAVAGLWFISGMSLLFKSTEFGFANKAAVVGGLFSAPVPVICLVVAVFLVTRFGELSPNARIVVLAALGIGGLDLLFGVIAFLAQFGADQGFGFAGVALAGKLVGGLLGLAQLLFLCIALFYAVTAFQGLPAPVPAAPQQWGDNRGYAQYGPGAAQQGWPPADPTVQRGEQPTWGQQSYGWVSPDQAQAQGQPGAAWGAPAGSAPQGWPPQSPAPARWEQPAPAGWSQPGPQPGYGAPEAAPAQQWPAEQPARPSTWGQPPTPSGETSTGYGVPGSPVADQPAADPVAPAVPEPAQDGLPDDAASAAGEPTTQPDSRPGESSVEEPYDQTRDDTPSTDQGWWQHPGQ